MDYSDYVLYTAVAEPKGLGVRNKQYSFSQDVLLGSGGSGGGSSRPTSGFLYPRGQS